MPQKMHFAPTSELLAIDEIVRLADELIARGVTRIRLTGGEPLVRAGIERLCKELGQRLGDGLEELTLSTNAMRLGAVADALHAAGIRRVNVSLDTRDPERFRYLTRHGELAHVLDGIAAAQRAGLKIKINMVALRGINEDEIAAMLRWCGAHGHDLTLIETMPMGDVEEDRTDHYLPLSGVLARLNEEFGLRRSSATTGGPARYYDIERFGLRLGFITPLTQNFCEGCNRIRISATGTAYGCLGQQQQVDLREALRSGDIAAVRAKLERLVAHKPRGHDFNLKERGGSVPRHMSVTGG
jgi:cyclic pyranopterin phosphate synthase